jgi:hypothetical protein
VEAELALDVLVAEQAHPWLEVFAMRAKEAAIERYGRKQGQWYRSQASGLSAHRGGQGETAERGTHNLYSCREFYDESLRR